MTKASTALDEALSWGLLACGSFGRLALSVHALPMIVPVRYTVGRGRLYVDLPDQGDLDEIVANSVVAFEADGFDDDAQRAWSVHAVGRLIARPPHGFDLEPSAVEGTWLTFF